MQQPLRYRGDKVGILEAELNLLRVELMKNSAEVVHLRQELIALRNTMQVAAGMKLPAAEDSDPNTDVDVVIEPEPILSSAELAVEADADRGEEALLLDLIQEHTGIAPSLDANGITYSWRGLDGLMRTRFQAFYPKHDGRLLALREVFRTLRLDHHDAKETTDGSATAK